jgi:hypothetical protein
MLIQAAWFFTEAAKVIFASVGIAVVLLAGSGLILDQTTFTDWLFSSPVCDLLGLLSCD